MPAQACPNRQKLRAYHIGELSEELAEEMIAHISECPPCQGVLDTFGAAGDTLMGWLKEPVLRQERLGQAESQEGVGRVAVLVAGEASGSAGLGGIRELGEYRLLAKLGEGGMGAVYKALHTRLEKVVALKVLPRDRTADSQAKARFEREMKAVGRLSHPNIVQAFDAREIDGTTVLVMEHVAGRNLSELVACTGPLRIADACELIRQAALGLQCAHENGLVHRDVKPSNLMLSTDGVVKILDMGLALLHTDQPPGEEMTSAGQAMGTADYMAPEQVDDAHSVDIRADLYSLGCTLYKLLCGEAPFSGPKYNTPIKKLMAHVSEPAPPILVKRTDVPKELAAVVDRLLAKDPARRFATPAEVVVALEPFTSGHDLPALLQRADEATDSQSDAITAASSTDEFCSSAEAGTQPSHAPKPRPLPRPSRRPPWKQIAVAAAAAGAVVLLGVILTLTNRHGTLVVETMDPDVEVVVRDKETGEVVASLRGQGTITLKPGKYAIEVEGDGYEIDLDDNTTTIKRGEKAVVKITRKPARLAAHGITITADPSLLPEPGTALSHMSLVVNPSPIDGIRSWTLETIGHRGRVECVAYRPDGRVLATAGSDGTIRIWDAANGELVRALIGHDTSLKSVSWSPDGKFLASASSDKPIRVWEVESGFVRELQSRAAIDSCICWSPDGRMLAVNTLNGPIHIWAMASLDKGVVRELDVTAVLCLAWSPDSKSLASNGNDGTLRLWDTESGTLQKTLKGPEGAMVAVDWSPDGKLVACGHLGPASCATVWDTTTDEVFRTLPGYYHGVRSIAWSPDGTALACGAAIDTCSVQVWQIETTSLLWEGEKREGVGGGRGVAYSPDGKTLAVGTYNGTVEFFEARSGRPLRALPGHGDEIEHAVFSPDGKMIASPYMHTHNEIRICGTDSGQLLRRSAIIPGRPKPVAWSADRLAIAVYGCPTLIWETGSRDLCQKLNLTGMVVALSPDGTTLVSRGGTEAKLWDVASGRLLCNLLPDTWSYAFSPDGKSLAVGSEQEIRICDARTGQRAQVLPNPESYSIQALGWTRDGKKLAGTFHHKLYVWDVESGVCTHNRTFFGWGAVPTLWWLDDDKTIAVGGNNCLLVWNTESDTLTRKVTGHYNPYRPCAFSPERRLVAFPGQGLIRLHRLDDGKLLRTILSLRDDLHGVLSPEGHYRGSPGLEEELVYVVQTDQGQETLTPDQFAEKYGWKNDPGRVLPSENE